MRCFFGENTYLCAQTEKKRLAMTNKHISHCDNDRTGAREKDRESQLGESMTVKVTYKRTRRLTVRIVSNGDVHVSAPMGMPRCEVERFVEEHRQWIAKARKKTCERQRHRAEFYQRLPLQTKAEADDARLQLQALIGPMVERHCMAMGVRPSRVGYKAMISRWGVCNVKDRSVCFSVYLLLLPEWCVEHVVVHELCHLLEPSHNDHFYMLMDRFFPRWREARRETRRICQNG